MISANCTHHPRPIPRAVKLRPEVKLAPYTTILKGSTALAALRAWLDAHESQIIRALVTLWDQMGGSITLGSLRDAMASGQIPQAWLDSFAADYSRFVTDVMVPQWAGAVSAGSLLSSGVPGWTWQGGVGWLTDYVRDHAGELVTNLTVEQTAAVRAALNHFIVEAPVSSTKLAQILRPMVGLNQRQMTAAINLRARLAEAGLTGDKLERRMMRYIAKANRLRAEMISRTELARSWHSAQYQSIREGIRTGAIMGRVTIQWDAAEDELTCPICSDLDGKVVAFEDSFTAEVEQGRGDNKHTAHLAIGETPPAHPNCRCSTTVRAEV